MKKYRPSNGTEGYSFIETYCENCIYERWTHFQEEDREEDKCDILTRSMVYDVDDKEYPEEWTLNSQGHHICTKHQPWDWSNGEPEPPPPDPDPRQLHLFPLEPVEKHKI